MALYLFPGIHFDQYSTAVVSIALVHKGYKVVRSTLWGVLIIGISSSVLAQQSAEPPQPPPPATDTVLHVNVNLVQLDAVVTDSKGHPVTDLKKEDFEALQDGKPQIITNFSFVENEPGEVVATPPSTPVLKRTDVRRTIAIVVDDLGLSFESTAIVRNAVKRFIAEQVDPGDLVAIIRTGKGVGVYQQFTTDRRVLLAAANAIHYSLINRVGVFSLPPSILRGPDNSTEDQRPQQDLDQFRSEYFTVGTLGALQWVLRGLRDMPGRKSLVLFSESLNMFNGVGQGAWVNDLLHRVVDAANRSSVVFYVIDPRGLVVLGPSAADATAPDMRQQFSDLWESQAGSRLLADETGGLFIHDDNDLNDAMRRVMADQKGYYLIGYKPDPSTFERVRREPQFHRFKLRLKARGRKLTIRSRAGFFGVPDEQFKAVPKTREQQLSDALLSPFGSSDIHLRLSALFADDPKIGPSVDTMLHVDARDLTFQAESNGDHKAELDVVVATFGQDGVPVDLTRRTVALQLKEPDYKACLENGAVFTLLHSVKKPGAYQFRAAVRDATANKLGSADQFIEVPNLRNKHLILSGIVLQERRAGNDASSTSVSGIEIPKNGWALRNFNAGAELVYTYEIMNLRRDSATRKPQVTSQLRILRDGKEVFLSQPTTIPAMDGNQDRDFAVQGAFHLGDGMQPGSYILQLFVTDNLAPRKHQTATQAVDFEIVAAPPTGTTAQSN